MELTVKELNELLNLALTMHHEVIRRSGTVAQASAGTADAPEHRPLGEPVGDTHCVPTPQVSSARFVIDTAEIQRVVAEALDAERETIAVMMANYAMAFPEAERGAVAGAVQMVQQRKGMR